MSHRGIVSIVIALAMSVIAGCKSTSSSLSANEALPSDSNAAPPPAVDPDEFGGGRR